MPIKNSIREKVGAAVSEAVPKREPEAPHNDTAKKISRLATATSISAFVATACLVFSFVTHAQASATVAEVKSDLVETVIATKDIPKGSVIKDSMVEVALVPSKYVASNSFTMSEEVVGKQTTVLISENSQIQTTELNGSNNNSSLSGRLAKGKKAVSIDVTTESDFACSLLHQGDRVSLYCFKGEKGSDKTQVELAKDVEVIALDGALSYDSLTASGKSASYSNVTVEVDQATASKIRETQDSEKTIWFVLSSQSDSKR